jgi:hypothetical protein
MFAPQTIVQYASRSVAINPRIPGNPRFAAQSTDCAYTNPASAQDLDRSRALPDDA